MSKLSFSDVILVTDWNTVHCLGIPNDAQINDELSQCILSWTFLTKEPIYNLSLEIYASFPICVCCF